MNVLRMIKMFGWERKMSARVDEKRGIELTWLWWNKVYTGSTFAARFRGFSLFPIPASG